MDRKVEEASKGQRKTVVILSDRSREIIRLFEERQQKRLRNPISSPTSTDRMDPLSAEASNINPPFGR
jgi:transposase